MEAPDLPLLCGVEDEEVPEGGLWDVAAVQGELDKAGGAEFLVRPLEALPAPVRPVHKVVD